LVSHRCQVVAAEKKKIQKYTELKDKHYVLSLSLYVVTTLWYLQTSPYNLKKEGRKNNLPHEKATSSMIDVKGH